MNNLTVGEALQIAYDILPKKALALHVKDKENSEEFYALLTTLIFREAHGLPFRLRR